MGRVSNRFSRRRGRVHRERFTELRSYAHCQARPAHHPKRYNVNVSRAIEDLYEQASRLSVEDRAELAGLLLESIEEEPDEQVEEAWAAEIERRMADYRAGRVKTIPWSELRARLHRSNR